MGGLPAQGRGDAAATTAAPAAGAEISYARAGAPMGICTCIWPGIAPMAIGLIATGCGGMCAMGIGRIPMGCDAGMYIGLAIPGGWCGR